MSRRKDADALGVMHNGQDVRLCAVCKLPMCLHGKCINQECRKFQRCNCLVAYRWPRDARRS